MWQLNLDLTANVAELSFWKRFGVWTCWRMYV